jgi:hypothetical protein
MLIGALHATLKRREVALQRVRVDRSANIPAKAVLNREMVLKLRADLRVMSRFIGHKHAFLREVGVHDRHNVRCAVVLAAAFNEAQSGLLVGLAASVRMLYGAFLLADEGFVDFTD